MALFKPKATTKSLYVLLSYFFGLLFPLVLIPTRVPLFPPILNPAMDVSPSLS